MHSSAKPKAIGWQRRRENWPNCFEKTEKRGAIFVLAGRERRKIFAPGIFEQRGRPRTLFGVARHP